ncbi:GNAT family N-acetyltransferase [Flavobacterium hydatis]|uniref:N-acetyltransferase n=1 Tax=Flavobacterium hydatis TaxID=991 RepID=A0A086AER1_FLAHY|nr:GNAT family N-acetyltransferase [Flavobacterium hydatis]KFF15175.1 hypothetical protein IW20_16085 [Flavobacterium hydatis]OXA88666.1 N-acetyltransferase [Flavobacterium hydatis]
MKIKDTLLLLPFRLLFFILEEMLKRMSRFILKNEIKEERDSFSALHKKYDMLKNEKENIVTENNALIARFNRFREIIKDDRNKTYELLITKNNEFTVIKYSKKKIFDTIRLLGESGNSKKCDSSMSFKKMGEVLKICDFQSEISEKGKGYGRVLMDFVIKKALEENIAYITGDLSNVDFESFNWLIPFYESFGFKCTLHQPDGKIIVGKIELNLNNIA